MSDINSQDLSQAILASPAKASIFLTVTVRSGGEAQVIDLLTDVSGLTQAVGFSLPRDDAQLCRRHWGRHVGPSL